jgi:serine-threonine kinase receptor-associated protein
MSTPTSVPATTSRKIPLICSGHSRPVPDLAYSPITDDGFFLVSACLDGKAMLRNGITGDWIGTFVGHKGAVWSAHINRNATKAVTGSADYTSKIWDALTGEELHSFTHSRIVKSVNFSHDSEQLVVTGGQDKIMRVFDLNKPDVAPIEFPAHTQPIKQVLWLNQHLLLSTTGTEPNFRVWDLRSKSEVNVIATAKNTPVFSIEVSSDGNHITGAGGKEVNFWNRNTFALSASFSVNSEVNSASLAPDAQTFVVGGNDFWARVYTFKSSTSDPVGGKELEVLKGHHGPVHTIRFAPDGQAFASGSEDGTIRLWQSGEVRSYGLWQETSNSTTTSATATAN